MKTYSYDGYRLMWMIVMFDLPVGTIEERKLAMKFRKTLLDEGFEMSQFSVYFRFCGDRSHTNKYVKRIRRVAPANGKISILFFTDKQFGEIISIQNQCEKKLSEIPEQYTLL